MDDGWRGDPTGSLSRRSRGEAKRHLRNNPAARRVRRGPAQRFLRGLLSTGSFGRFVVAYLVVDAAALCLEALTAHLAPGWIPPWTAPGPNPDIKALVLNVSGYLVGVQVGALGVISLALALVTLIAQRESSSTDVRIYYDESCAYGLVASSVALLSVSCAQLLWPAQFALHRLGLGTGLQAFKLGLLGIHLAWLLANLAGLAHFVATTFSFVQRSAREAMRERYTAEAVQRKDMADRLRRERHLLASQYVLGEAASEPSRPTIRFGFDFGEPGDVELASTFRRAATLVDVRVRWVRWVFRRWARRCGGGGAAGERPSSAPAHVAPTLRFTPDLDVPLAGTVDWCLRSGGVPLTRIERFVLRRSFRFSWAASDPAPPAPTQILEELADKVAVQIDHLAPIAFGEAFDELIRYHRFLLELNASRGTDGRPASYADVSGGAWHPPQRDWIRQYGRLFDLAADRIPDDGRFIARIAHAAARLLPEARGPELPSTVIGEMLNLGPIMVHRVEAWVTRRTSVDVPEGGAAEPRLTLAGSDARAYANVLPDLVGAWEALLTRRSGRRRKRGSPDDDAARWTTLREDWPFLWKHLSNTAHCLAIAVWNEDEAGAGAFREALLRWPGMFDLGLDVRGEPRPRPWLLPDVLDLEWPEASRRGGSAQHGGAHRSPDVLFATVLHDAHRDVVLLTTALFLSWTMGDKQASDIGARTARALLRREGQGDDGESSERDPSLRILAFDVMRLEAAGDPYDDASYASVMDTLVQTLDGMTERRVVPGRVFTPSTLHGRDGLHLPTLAILASAMPVDGDDGLVERVAGLARDEDALPARDRSLREVARAVSSLASTAGRPWPGLARGVSILAPGRDPEALVRELGGVLAAASAAIGAERLRRLRDRRVDPGKLERIRGEVEAALLAGPLEAPFLQSVRAERGNRGDDAVERRVAVFTGVDKAQLLEPAMAAPTSGFEAMFPVGAKRVAGRQAWADFARRPRTRVDLDARLDEEGFWRAASPHVAEVGSAPALVVSRRRGGLDLLRVHRGPPTGRPRPRTTQRPRDEVPGSYLVTVEGVDVFGADLPDGEVWLFSGAALRSVHYLELDARGRFVDVNFEADADTHGRLVFGFRQRLEWSTAPIFQIGFTPPGVADD